MKLNPYILLAITILIASCKSNSNNQKVFNDKIYLGQQPPGVIPKLFAPEIIKNEFREAAAAFSPDAKEFYFRRRGGKYKKNILFVIKNIDNQWVESELPTYAGEPFVTPDAKTLFLGRKYREKTNTGWGEVKDTKSLLDDKDRGIMRLTASINGTYVFDDYKSDDIIRISTVKNGKRENPKILPKHINTGKWTAHPFIAPDESYLIWDSEREEGHGDNDLYISFKQADGSWGKAINLGDKINTEAAESYGSISSDGNYFFFHRGYGGNKADIYWVDAKVVLSLKENNGLHQ